MPFDPDTPRRADLNGRRGAFPLQACGAAASFMCHLAGRVGEVRAVRLSTPFTIYLEGGVVQADAGQWVVQFADGSAQPFRPVAFEQFFERLPEVWV